MGSLPSDPSGFLFAGALCLGLALAFCLKALIPSWRRRWGWGRGDNVSITLLGHAGIVLAFLIIGASSLAAYFGFNDGFVSILPFVGFVVFMLAGVHDTAVSRKK